MIALRSLINILCVILGWVEILGRRLDDGYGNGSDASKSIRDSSIELWDTLAKVIAAMPVRFISVQALKAYVLISEDPDLPCYNKQCISAFSEFQVRIKLFLTKKTTIILLYPLKFTSNTIF